MISEETIELFVRGKMSEADAAVFQQQMRLDPALQKEVSFQSSLIQGIQKNRNLELKQRLQQIHPSTIPSGSHYVLKGLAVASASAVVVGSLYFMFTKPQASDRITENSKVERQIEPQVSENLKEDIQTPIDLSRSNTEQPQQPAKITVTEQTSILSHVESKKEAKSVANFKSKVPNISEESDAFSDLNVADGKEPEVSKDPEDNRHNAKNEIAIENIIDSKYSFHYKYNNQKLFLYGDFKQKPYELLEFNKTNKKGLYLYFDSNYYEIADTQNETVKMKKITEASLLKELEKEHNVRH